MQRAIRMDNLLHKLGSAAVDAGFRQQRRRRVIYPESLNLSNLRPRRGIALLTT